LKMMEELGDRALNRADVERIVKEKDIADLTHEQILRIDTLLESVKICDPAIGSGAFPMGLLQEIFSIKEIIAYELELEWNAAGVKENIIQRSIYGVDIERGAVDIARLRFWLSLLVDSEDPKPLPNLEYKIVVGNSLISMFEGEPLEVDWEIKEGSQSNMFGHDELLKRQELLKKITDTQKAYFHADAQKKRELALHIRNQKIDLLINQLSLMIQTKGEENKPAGSGKKVQERMERYLNTKKWKQMIKVLSDFLSKPEEPFNHFDWKLDFPEVLNEQIANQTGFDIVIGNPPYYQLREVSKRLQEIYKGCKYHKYAVGGRLNVFQYFVPFAIEKAKKEGVICLITQNSILAEDTAINNRKYIFTNTRIVRFDSFPERDNKKKRVFEDVKMSVALSTLVKSDSAKNTFQVNIWNDKYMSDKSELVVTKNDILELFPKNLIIPLTSEKKWKLLRKIKNIENRFFVTAYAGEIDMTKYRDKFNLNEQGERVLTGAQVLRYRITDNPSQGDLIYLQEKYIPDTNKASFHNSSRIVMQRITGVDSSIRLIMTLIPPGYLCSNSTNFIVSDKLNQLKYILGVLNSSLINQYFKFTSTNTNVTTTEIQNIPIPRVSDQVVNRFSEIVNRILDLKREKKDTTSLENKIDKMVYRLYELTHEEVMVLDEEFEMKREEYEGLKIQTL